MSLSTNPEHFSNLQLEEHQIKKLIAAGVPVSDFSHESYRQLIDGIHRRTEIVSSRVSETATKLHMLQLAKVLLPFGNINQDRLISARGIPLTIKEDTFILDCFVQVPISTVASLLPDDLISSGMMFQSKELISKSLSIDVWVSSVQGRWLNSETIMRIPVHLMFLTDGSLVHLYTTSASEQLVSKWDESDINHYLQLVIAAVKNKLAV